MKKQVLMLVCLIALVCVASYVQVVFAAGEPSSFLWIEAENYTSKTGAAYTTETVASASGGKYIQTYTTAAGTYKVKYDFNVEETGNYDIWILSTPGNQTWLSKYKWQLDGGGFLLNPSVNTKQIYTSNNSWKAPIGWSRITTGNLNAAAHSLEFYCDVKRDNNDYYYHNLDCIVIVPSSWGWTPPSYNENLTTPLADWEAVVLEKKVLDLYIKADDIKDGLILPAAGTAGTTIQWSSSVDTVIDGSGNVMLPPLEENVPVDLIATISKGEYSDTVSFELNKTHAYLWVEAENSTPGGGYVIRENPSASNRKLLVLDSTDTATRHETSISFDVSRDNNYDIWVLATPQGYIWSSEWQWSLDGGDYLSCDPNNILPERVFNNLGKTIELKWHKISSMDLTRGSHNISIYTPELREAARDLFLQCIDVIAIVPPNWQWVPSSLSEPYDKYSIHAQYVEGEISSETSNQDSTLTVTVKNKVSSPVTGKPFIYAEISVDGDTVSRVVKQPDVAMDSWQPGEIYTDVFDIQVPFNARNGRHEVRTGIFGVNYENGDASSLVSEVTIGTEAKLPDKAIVNVNDIEIPGTVDAGQAIKASLTVQSTVDSDTSPYLTLWKNDVLWGVIETEKTVSLHADDVQKIDFEFEIKEAIPKGAYELKAGFHQLASEQVDDITLQLTGSVDSDFTYKPLSNGMYYSEKTGLSHLWYVNQFHTMIWDGKPYIPIGGMVCFNYLDYFSIDDIAKNKANWQKDVALIEELKDEGVKDFYINPGQYGTNIPSWAWEYLLDYIDGQGFRYGIQMNERMGGGKPLDSYYIRANDIGAESVRVKDVTESGRVELAVSGASFTMTSNPVGKGVKFIVINQNTQEPVQYGDGEITLEADGKFHMSADVTLPDDSKYTVAFTPKFQVISNKNMSNYMEYAEDSAKRIAHMSDTLNTGDNFRLWVDLTMNESGVLNDNESARFFTPGINNMFEEWLRKKYRNIENLNSHWKTMPEIETFAEASAIVPLYTTSKTEDGEYVTYFTGENKLYTVDIYRGTAWSDFTDFRSDKYMEFCNDMAEVAKKNSNVPVVYKEAGCFSPYFVNKKQSGGFDGIGAESYGNYNTASARQGHAYSESEHAAKTMWQIVTETETDEKIARKYESEQWGYPSEEYMHGHFDALINSGARGIYDFLLNCNIDSQIQHAYSYVVNPHMYPWLSSYREKINSETPMLASSKATYDVGYFYPGGRNWWYKPNLRQAVHYEGDVKNVGYAQTEDGVRIMSSSDASVDTKLLITTMEDSPATQIFGESLCRAVALNNKPIVFFGMRNNLGALPEIDKYYTAEKISISESETIQILKQTETAEVLYATDDGKPWAIRDGNLWIIATDNWTEYSEELGSEFVIIKYIKDLGIYGSHIVEDVTPPTTTSVIAAEKGNNEWYISDAIVELSSSDDVTGVAYTKYRMSGSEESVTYMMPVEITENGIYNIEYYSVDNADNSEDIKTQTVRIDKNAPSYDITVSGSVLSEDESFEDYQPLTLTVLDYPSGIANIWISVTSAVYGDKISVADIVYGSEGSAVDTLKFNMDLAGKTGELNMEIILEDNAGNRLVDSFTFTVTTSIDSMRKLMESYISSGELNGALVDQLTNNLNQAESHFNKGKMDQAVKHMEDFIKHLNNKALKDSVGDKEKEILNADAAYLVGKWSVK